MSYRKRLEHLQNERSQVIGALVKGFILQQSYTPAEILNAKLGSIYHRGRHLLFLLETVQPHQIYTNQEYTAVSLLGGYHLTANQKVLIRVLLNAHKDLLGKWAKINKTKIMVTPLSEPHLFYVQIEDSYYKGHSNSCIIKAT